MLAQACTVGTLLCSPYPDNTSKAAFWLQPGAPKAVGHPSGQLGWYVYAFIALGALLLAFLAYKVWLHWQGHAAELTLLDKAIAAMLRVLRRKPKTKSADEEVFGSLKIRCQSRHMVHIPRTISSTLHKGHSQVI